MKNMFLFLTVFLISMVSVLGYENDFYFKTGSDIELNIPCTFNGTFCPSSYSKCNISVNDPDGFNVVNNKAMAYGNSKFQYNLSFLNKTGSYFTVVACQVYSFSQDTSFYFELNNIGQERGGFGGIIALIIFMILCCVLLFSFFSKTIMFPVIVFGSSIVVYFCLYLIWAYTISSGIWFTLYQISGWMIWVSALLMLWDYSIRYFTYMSKKRNANFESKK
jgi:hypothetical protein